MWLVTYLRSWEAAELWTRCTLYAGPAGKRDTDCHHLREWWWSWPCLWWSWPCSWWSSDSASYKQRWNTNDDPHHGHADHDKTRISQFNDSWPVEEQILREEQALGRNLKIWSFPLECMSSWRWWLHPWGWWYRCCLLTRRSRLAAGHVLLLACPAILKPHLSKKGIFLGRAE